ncbi:MAG: PKD domain-containing protein [Bacteroidetes bacterium]|nr:PKD domain-containing protein [Bacteroidota bacterium]
MKNKFFLLLIAAIFPIIGNAQPASCVLGISNSASACLNAPVTFTNGTAPITCFPCYIWNFPGGTPSSFIGTNPPPVTYSSPGTYTVILYGANAGCVITDSANDVTTSTIVIEDTLQPVLSITPNPACPNVTLTFLNNTVGDNNVIGAGITSTTWDFGDNTTISHAGYQPAFFHSYSSPGIYFVTLCVTNSCGTECVTQQVKIDSASAHFTWDANCRVHFYADTTCAQSITSYSWNFGDPQSGPNNTSSSADPYHTFTLNNHTYIVSLTITTSYNTTTTYSATVIQPGPPDATISGFQTNNCGSGFITYNSPCQNGIVYTWTATGGTPVLSTGCTTNIDWTNPAGGMLVLSAFDSLTDCTGHDTIIIPPCCDTASSFALISITNRTASSVLADPVFASYLNGSALTSSGEIIVNGVFTIDVPFSFLLCPLIEMGPNAVINILPGQTLTIDNSQTNIKCGYMWDGIYINGTLATLNVVNNSVLAQARNAVVSIGGGKYFIEKSSLKNNYKDIIVQSFGGYHPGVVRNTTFTMQGTFLPAIPALPFGQDKTVCGIEINDNANIIIGDASSSTYQNNFNNILVGVRSRSSATVVQNCKFSNLTATTLEVLNVPNAGTGVVATGSKATYYQPSILVGGATNIQRCVFSNMRIGVDAGNDLNVSVLNNTISNIRIYGVTVHQNPQRGIAIERNTISNASVTYGFNTAILVLETQDAFVNIDRNLILQSNLLAQQNGTGIRVALVSPGNVQLNITNNNSINRVRTGIWLQNLVGKDMVFVKSNTINFSKPNASYTTVHYGIRLEGCATIRCDTNLVQKSGANPNLAMLQNLRGISIENSPVTIATDNIFRRMGSGIFGWEISSASTLACNTLDHCYNGVFFTGSASTSFACDIGDQIVDPLHVPSATGNTWMGTVSTGDDVAGAVSPGIFWRYNTSTSPGISAGGVTPQLVSYNACNTFFAPLAQVQRDQQVGAALRSAAQTNTSSETHYQLHRYAYRKLSQTPSWLYLNTTDDSIYQNFYNSYNPTNIGTFRQIEIAADTGNYQFVSSASNFLMSSNPIEDNLKTVYGIYSATWMHGIYSFSSADSATLLNIALQDPVAGGTAVYSARVMLDLPVDYYGLSTQRTANADQQNPVLSDDLKIYPNPTNEIVNLEYGIDDGQNAQVEIFDLTGNLLLSKQLAPQQEVYMISTAELESGVYMIRLVVNGESTKCKRLIIVK